MTHHVPNGFHTVTPFILVKHADRVIDFLQRAFGASEIYRLKHEDGSVWHSQIKIGNSMIMLGDVQDNRHSMASSIYLYLPDADAAYQNAMKAGATSIMPPEDQFYGDRSGGVRDLMATCGGSERTSRMSRTTSWIGALPRSCRSERPANACVSWPDGIVGRQPARAFPQGFLQGHRAAVLAQQIPERLVGEVLQRLHAVLRQIGAARARSRHRTRSACAAIFSAAQRGEA